MGMFITFEGQEGAGKSTQAKLLYDCLSVDYPTILTREPGGTELTEHIRSIIMDRAHNNMTKTTEALLFLAARSQLVEEVIRPHLSRGGIVICDRFIDSTIAYQAFGNDLGVEFITKLCDFTTSGLMPCMTFLLEVDPLIGLGRKHGELDRIESRPPEFHAAVKAGYQYVAETYKDRIVTIDSSLGIEDIHKTILNKVKDIICIKEEQ